MLMAYRVAEFLDGCAHLSLDALKVRSEVTTLNQRFEMPVWTARAGHLLKESDQFYTGSGSFFLNALLL